MAIEIDKDWRKKEENLQEIIKKYPAVSPFIIIQLILQRMFVSSGLLNLILYHSM